jgi:hypothetical protein
LAAGRLLVRGRSVSLCPAASLRRHRCRSSWLPVCSVGLSGVRLCRRHGGSWVRSSGLVADVGEAHEVAWRAGCQNRELRTAGRDLAGRVPRYGPEAVRRGLRQFQVAVPPPAFAVGSTRLRWPRAERPVGSAGSSLRSTSGVRVLSVTSGTSPRVNARPADGKPQVRVGLADLFAKMTGRSEPGKPAFFRRDWRSAGRQWL